MTVLVSGASGYLGRHIVARLEAGLWSYTATSRSGVVGLPCDLTDKHAVGDLLWAVQPDVTIHAAALVPKRPKDYDDHHQAHTSIAMAALVRRHDRGLLVYCSSLVAEHPTTAYAQAKRYVEEACIPPTIILRLPGLFGLPRRWGVIYDAVRSGILPQSFGPFPAMFVEDAAAYVVKAATQPSDGNPAPFNVTYDDERLQHCYGSLGVTCRERVEQFRAQLQQEVNA